MINILLNAIKSGGSEEVWKVAEHLGEQVQVNPELVWHEIASALPAADKDAMQAIASHLLEHLLQYHFDRYFPEVEAEIRRGNRKMWLGLRSSWKMGQAELPANARRWEEALRLLH